MRIIEEAIVFTSNLDSCGRSQSEHSIYIKCNQTWYSAGISKPLSLRLQYDLAALSTVHPTWVIDGELR